MEEETETLGTVEVRDTSPELALDEEEIGGIEEEGGMKEDTETRRSSKLVGGI